MLTKLAQETRESVFIISIAVLVAGIGVMGGLMFSRYLENRTFHHPVASAPDTRKGHVYGDATGHEATSLFNTRAVFAVSEPFREPEYPVL